MYRSSSSRGWGDLLFAVVSVPFFVLLSAALINQVISVYSYSTAPESTSQNTGELVGEPLTTRR